MKKFWIQIKLFYYLIQTGRNPKNTEAVLAIGPCLYQLGYLEQARQKVLSDPKTIELVKTRRLLNPVDLKTLSLRPPGTLAAVYTKHMVSNNLDPQFYKDIKIENDETYFMMRMRQTHDLWHAITGFNTTVEDEIALLAFMYAQTRSPLIPLLIGASLLKVGLKNEVRGGLVFSKISQGWQMGEKAKPIFALDWEKNWDTPIEQLRAEFSVTPAY